MFDQLEYEETSLEVSYSWPHRISLTRESENQYGYVLSCTGKEVRLPADEVKNLSELILPIRIDICPKGASGLDGTTWRIKITNGCNSVTYEWWSDTAGEKWNELYILRDMLVALRDKYFRQGTVEGQ